MRVVQIHGVHPRYQVLPVFFLLPDTSVRRLKANHKQDTSARPGGGSRGDRDIRNTRRFQACAQAQNHPHKIQPKKTTHLLFEPSVHAHARLRARPRIGSGCHRDISPRHPIISGTHTGTKPPRLDNQHTSCLKPVMTLTPTCAPAPRIGSGCDRDISPGDIRRFEVPSLHLYIHSRRHKYILTH